MAKQIQSLERGLFILESIVFSREPVTAIEIARMMGVHKSTVSHLTGTLIGLGYLEKAPGSSRLIPSEKLFRLARTMGTPVEIIRIARPHIEQLAGATGETAHLAELRGRSVFFLENRYPEQALRVQTVTGDVEPAHSTAVGKAMLSGLSDEEIRALFGADGLDRFTEKTIGSIDALLEELEKVRKAGLAFDNEEQTPGTRCIAAPLRGPWGRVIASVGVSGLVGRESSVSVEDEVKKCALEIEKDIERNLTTVRGRQISRNGKNRGNGTIEDSEENITS